MSYSSAVQQIEERFWSFVDRSGGPDACWPWTGGLEGKGYGSFRIDGRTQRAAHVALLLAGRPLAPGEQALHHCDNPPCCNPFGDRHLFAGTQTENIADMDAKGRRRVGMGERHALAKLTADGVRIIRSRYAAGGETLRSLGDEFGVTKGAIYHVLSGRTWTHVE